MPLRETLLQSIPYSASAEATLNGIQQRSGAVPEAYRSIAVSQMYLSDTTYNLRKTLADKELDSGTKHIIAVATASASGSGSVTEAMAAEARTAGLTDAMILEAITVAASITSHNIFYKFRHLSGEGYGDFKPMMKLTVLTRPEILSSLQVELICAIVSVINDCSFCVRIHLAKCRDLGATPEQIEEALRTGAVVAGMGAFAVIGE